MCGGDAKIVGIVMSKCCFVFFSEGGEGVCEAWMGIGGGGLRGRSWVGGREGVGG